MITQFIDNFITATEKNVISVLRSENVLPDKLAELFEQLKNFINQDEQNLFVLLDIISYGYLYEDDTWLENDHKITSHIRPALLTLMVNNLRRMKSEQFKKYIANSPKKVIYDFLMRKVRRLFIDIFKNHHKITVNLPDGKDNEKNVIILLLIEFTYRKYLAGLKVISASQVKKKIDDISMPDNVNFALALDYAMTIKKTGRWIRK